MHCGAAVMHWPRRRRVVVALSSPLVVAASLCRRVVAPCRVAVVVWRLATFGWQHWWQNLVRLGGNFADGGNMSVGNVSAVSSSTCTPRRRRRRVVSPPGELARGRRCVVGAAATVRQKHVTISSFPLQMPAKSTVTRLKSRLGGVRLYFVDLRK